jgi:hypothetical protein
MGQQPIYTEVNSIDLMNARGDGLTGKLLDKAVS